jgi:hypothetical protein
MIQFGYNAGARHAHVFGFVHNIKCQMPSNECVVKDHQILGILGISWAIFKAVLPHPVYDTCASIYVASGMPSMSTSAMDDTGET